MATVEITKDNMHDILEQNEIVVLDFWADWCEPCKAFDPILAAASERHSDIVFGKVNTEAEDIISRVFQIRSIPTGLIFKQNIGVFRESRGFRPTELETMIAKTRELDMDEIRERIAQAQAEAEAEAESEHLEAEEDAQEPATGSVLE